LTDARIEVLFGLYLGSSHGQGLSIHLVCYMWTSMHISCEWFNDPEWVTQTILKPYGHGLFEYYNINHVGASV